MRVIKYSQAETASKSTVQLNFKTVNQLLDLDDPSPYPHKELTEVAEYAIASHVGDVPIKKDVELVLSLPSGAQSGEIQENLAETIRQHFAFRATEAALEVARKKARLKLGIKITIALIAIVILAGGVIALIPVGDDPRVIKALIGGILTILVWAGVWDLFEAYAIEYRDLVIKMKVYEKVARMNMRIEQA